jgi:hypothetical protein
MSSSGIWAVVNDVEFDDSPWPKPGVYLFWSEFDALQWAAANIRNADPDFPATTDLSDHDCVQAFISDLGPTEYFAVAPVSQVRSGGALESPPSED